MRRFFPANPIFRIGLDAMRHMNSQQIFAVPVCMLTGFMSPFMSSSLNLCVPAMSAEFSCGATAVTWVITSYTLGTAMFSIPFGNIADVKGRRSMLIAGTVSFTVCSAACAFAPSIELLIAARFGMAVSGDAILAANVALMLLAFPPERKGSSSASMGLSWACCAASSRQSAIARKAGSERQGVGNASDSDLRFTW